MRQLIVQVPRGHGARVLDIAKNYDATNSAQFEGSKNEDLLDLVLVHVSNSKIEKLLGDLEEIPDLHVTLIPRGVVSLHPPADEAAEQVKNVETLNPLEVFLQGLQSVGSWKGFIGYAAAAGVVVWIGLFTNTAYLLVAAMLIAPFAGPAMNTAIATARGDGKLFRRSLWRYCVSLVVTIGVTAALSFILQQKIPTSIMLESSQVSAVAVLLPLVAGAAGALSLVQSERSSLVSGAATGMLVAASLAPPAGIVGMSSAIRRWDLAVNGVFLLLLQLAGINFSAALVFRTFGMSSQGVRYKRGKKWLFPAILTGTVLMLASLLTWQFSNSPNLQRSSRSQRTTAEIQQVVNNSQLVELVETNVRFTRSKIKDQNTLLGVIYVQKNNGVTQSSEEISTQLTSEIQRHLLKEGFNVTPLINVVVLDAPPSLAISD